MGLPQGAVVADVGCGNGKYFAVRPDLIVLGSDRSSGLAEQAAKLCRGLDSKQPGISSNGRNLQENPHADATGSVKAPHADVFVADALQLPLKVQTEHSLLPVYALVFMSQKCCLLWKNACQQSDRHIMPAIDHMS